MNASKKTDTPPFVVRAFNELSLVQLYNIMALRQEVFSVEQNSCFVDADGYDQHALHVFASDRLGGVVAYARVIEPGMRYTEASIGRVATHANYRGIGLGKEAMKQALSAASDTYGPVPICISAQAYLEQFYTNFGFKAISGPYQEFGIWHIDMLRS